MNRIFENINFFKNKQVAGLQLNFTSEDNYNINCTLLIEKNSLIEIEKTEQFDSLNDLFDSLNLSIPIYLSIDGKGIIHKKIENEQGLDNNVLLNNAFPNLKVKDFYMQENAVDENTVFLSIVRKSKVDKLLKEFNDRKCFILDLTLGPFDLKYIFNMLSNSENVVWSDNYKISHSNSEITDLNKFNNIKKDVEYNFGEEKVSNLYIVSLASAIKNFIKYDETKSDLINIFKNQKKEFLYKKIFKYGSWALLLFVFLSLLINYFLFDHYNNKQAELSIQFSHNKSLFQELEELREELKMKEDFFNENRIFEASQLSFYADRIAYLLPRSLTLGKMDIQPVIKRNRLDEKIDFLIGIIHINGTADNSPNFNNWIKKLKSEPWINKINILNYNQDNIRKLGEFEIEIFIIKK